MSFFDEDDEPPRTARTRVRRSPAPRRGRVTSSGSADPQTLLVRRMIAGIVGVLILLFLFFGVRACSTSRTKNALRDYNERVSSLGTESRNTGEQFFKQMDAAGQTSPQDLYQAVLGYKNSAKTTLDQAKALSVPGDMAPAQQSLLIALEMRRDGLESVASRVREAMGDQGDVADRAITQIAGAMRNFDASDVLYRGRVVPFLESAMKNAKVSGNILPSEFLPEISWMSPNYVASKLGQQLSAGDNGDGDQADGQQTTGPGLHGTGLNATSYGSVTLQPGTSNRLTYVKGQPFTVSFTNQGDNDEFNVKVTLKIARSSGSPITLNKTVEQIAKGEKATVELPLNREPPLGTVLTINVNVAAVPGEKKTDNNKSSYPTLFVQG